MGELPYYKQQTPFTCSLACLRMVLESVDKKFAELELAKIIGFSPKVGFSPAMILKVCEIINVKCELRFDVTLEELKEVLSKQTFPITLINPGILYELTEVEHRHYVIIKNINEEEIIINDPDQKYGGESKQVNIQKFLKAWEPYKMAIIIKGERK